MRVKGQKENRPRIYSGLCELDMLYKVGYLFKTIDLLGPYRRAWDALCGEGAWQLNSELKEFTTGLREVKKYRKTMGYSGVLHPGHSEYLGTRKRDRMALSRLHHTAAGNRGSCWLWDQLTRMCKTQCCAEKWNQLVPLLINLIPSNRFR